jgi:coenzyme F420-reducing hydrogenase delta subunit
MEKASIQDRVPKVYLFYCSSNLDLTTRTNDYSSSASIRPIPVSCAGKIDILYLTKAFETGADGIMIVTCAENKCQYLEGDTRAKKRAGFVDLLMAEAGLSKGRIAVIQTDNDVAKVMNELEEFVEKVKGLSEIEAAGKTQVNAVQLKFGRME